nr:HK97 family phage prohead protease [Rhodococcus wratislaviensis]GLK38663.1 hypothetical protein GCM10017611_55300 [Rhodococcus wratislaviensis]
MSSNLITRATPSDLEIRSGGDGRTLCGICVPFDTPTHIRDFEGEYDEQIVRGAVAVSIRERGDRVKLLSHHDSRTNPLGRATLLREDAHGLYGEFRISQTQAGDEALALINDGALDSLSIGFRAVRQTWTANRSRRTLHEIALHEVSLVNFGAYSGALVSGVRSSIATPIISAEAAQRRLRANDHL